MPGTPGFSYELFKKAEHGAGDQAVLQKLRSLDQQSQSPEGLFGDTGRATEELNRYRSIYPLEMRILDNEKEWRHLEPAEQVQILSKVTNENMADFLKNRFGIVTHLDLHQE